MVGTTVSHYTVLEKLGEGGMGVVYKAIDTRLERFVALKFLPDDYAHDEALRDRFLREARAASALSDPNICTIYDVGDEDGKIFMAMEFLDGVTLKELVRRGPLDYERLLDIGVDITDGLNAAHSAGIIHRDIKLANIFVTKGGRTKILDFGLAKKTVQRRPALVAAINASSSGPSEDTNMTSGLAALGTAAYMSPEQALGQALDERTDLFSFGIVLYEMATGQAPFKGDTTGLLFLSIVQDTPEPPRELNPDVPDELQRIIGRSLEKDRETRYQHASEIRADLQRLRMKSASHQFAVAALAAEISASGNGDGWKRQTDSKPSRTSVQERPSLTLPAEAPTAKPRRRWKTVAAAVTLAAILVAAGLYLRSRNGRTLTMHDSIVVADFANTTGDQIFDGTLRRALAVDLGQSPYLNVVSDRRVAAALTEMEKPTGERLSWGVAREVCLRTNGEALVTGSIAKEENQYQIELSAVNCQTDKSIATVQVEASSRDAVIKALGDAGRQLRRKLGESLRSLERFNTPLAEATTSSLEALQAFTTGGTLRDQKGNAEALPYLKQAVELDPNFALAYAVLGGAYLNLEESSLGREKLAKAFELRNRVSDRERFQIESAYYRNVTGEMSKEMETNREWTRLYPGDALPHIRLANGYGTEGHFEKDAEELREAIRLAPEMSTPYTNLILVYTELKRLDEAKATYEAARARKVESENLQIVRYDLAFVERDTATMQQLVESAKGKPSYENRLALEEANTAAYFGQFARSRELIQQAIATALAGGTKESAAQHAAQHAWTEAEVGNRIQAQQFAEQALSLSKGNDVLDAAALAFARAGDAAQAENLVEQLNQDFPAGTIMQNYTLPTVRALIEIDRQHPAQAVAILEAARPYELAMRSYADLHPAYVRGMAYLQLKNGEKAAKEFEKVVDNAGLIVNSVIGALSYLQLARAEEMMGDHAAARTHYQDFLAFWKDADPDIPILKQAQAEYAKLK